MQDAGRARPPARRRAARLSSPSPPASTPISSTSESGTNGVNIPIELEPPPTQAITRAGSSPSAARACSRASSPITRCRSRTRDGNGAGPTAEPIT